MNEEYQIQIALVHWLRKNYPNVLFTIAPQGMKLPIGVAAKIKRMGYNKGCPDIMIFEPRNGICGIIPDSHGLFIELKTSKGKVSPEQRTWLTELDARGYATHVCRSCEDAIIVIEKYLKK